MNVFGLIVWVCIAILLIGSLVAVFAKIYDTLISKEGKKLWPDVAPENVWSGVGLLLWGVIMALLYLFKNK